MFLYLLHLLWNCKRKELILSCEFCHNFALCSGKLKLFIACRDAIHFGLPRRCDVISPNKLHLVMLCYYFIKFWCELSNLLYFHHLLRISIGRWQYLIESQLECWIHFVNYHYYTIFHTSKQNECFLFVQA